MRRRGALLAAVCAGLAVVPAHGQEPAPEVVIRGAPSRSPGERTLPAAAASQVAGTQGDPIKGLQGMPGLGRGGIGGGELVAWGSPPSDSRIELDGVPLPQLYHGSGVRSVVQAGTIESLRLSPGAFGAEHGRALGGLLLVHSRPADTLEPHLRLSADLLDASALASTPVASGNAAAQVAARYGYVDRWLPKLIEPELRGLYRVPRYWDAQAEGHLRLGPTSSARLVVVVSSDQSSTELEQADPARTTRQEIQLDFGRLYLAYRQGDSDGSETRLTPFVGWDHQQLLEQQGAAPSELSARTLRYGLRARHRAPLGQSLALVLGLDAEGSVSQVERGGSLSVPRREGDPYPFGTPPGNDVAHDDFTTHVLGIAPFAELELQAAGWLIVPALRFEPLLVEASRSRPPIGTLPVTGSSRLEALLEPRLRIERRLSPEVSLLGAVGRYHQPPTPVDLSARFGNPTLSSSSATHLVVGEATRLLAATRLEVMVFAKWLSQLATRPSEPEPRLAESLSDSGSGRSYGAQLFLRRVERAGFSGWLGATLSRSERREADGTWRLSDFDSPLVLACSVLQRLGRFRLGARARYASGMPRTPVVGAYYDLATQRSQPLLGATNSVRLRDFFQLDLRLDRSFQLGDQTRLELYIDALNVTFRHNEEEWTYSSDFTQIGSVSGLPPLAILGVTLER